MAALLLAGGCSLLPEKSPAEQRPTDAMGEGLRGIPDDQGAADSLSSKKQPFWEKYRDKRVRQIEGNLNVE